MTEDEMVGWHHRLNGHEFEQALGVGDGQGSLACCSSWGHKELDITEWLNWAELKFGHFWYTKNIENTEKRENLIIKCTISASSVVILMLSHKNVTVIFSWNIRYMRAGEIVFKSFTTRICMRSTGSLINLVNELKE